MAWVNDRKIYLSSFPESFFFFFLILHAGKHVQAIWLYETSAQKIDITKTMLNVKVIFLNNISLDSPAHSLAILL